MKVINNAGVIIDWLSKHRITHEDGGVDEISLTDLSGDPADTINESLLTTQNDVIVRGASIAERLAIGASRIIARLASGNVVAANPAQILAILTSQAGAAFSWNGQDLTKIGVIFLTEQAAAESDVAGDGQFWTKTDTPNYPMFTDDVGNDSPLLNVAYSSLWFHGLVVTLTISTQNAFTKITQFVNIGEEDRYGNVVGDSTTDDDLTINLAGVYDLSLQASMTNAGGGPVEFNLGIMIILNTALTITDATNATPIVITSSAHGLKTGDGVVITGVGGNTAAIGDFTITRLSADSFSLQDLSHTNIAGNGAYTSGGTVDKIAPGSLILERIVSNTQMGRGALAGTYSLSVGDLVEGYAVNLDGTEDIKFEQIQIAVSLK